MPNNDQTKTQTLNPNLPEDAVQIIDHLTKDLQLKRAEANIFNLALNTIDIYIKELNKSVTQD